MGSRARRVASAVPPRFAQRRVATNICCWCVVCTTHTKVIQTVVSCALCKLAYRFRHLQPPTLFPSRYLSGTRLLLLKPTHYVVGVTQSAQLHAKKKPGTGVRGVSSLMKRDKGTHNKNSSHGHGAACRGVVRGS